MANEMENAVVETTENTEKKVGFFKKHGKKIGIGLGVLGAGGLGFLFGKAVSSKKTTNTCDSDDYDYKSNDETVD